MIKNANFTAEKEKELVRAWQDNNDYGARVLLVEGFGRMIHGYAQKHARRNSQIPYDDFMQEGQLAFLDAINKGNFDPDGNMRLASYAGRWFVDYAMIDYSFRTKKAVETPRSSYVLKILKAARHAEQKIRQEQPYFTELEVKVTVADKIGVTLEVLEAAQTRYSSSLSLNANMTGDGERDGDEFINWLPEDEECNTALRVINGNSLGAYGRIFENAVANLQSRPKSRGGIDARQLEIFTRRRAKDDTLDVLSQHFKISKERVRQLDVEAEQRIIKECGKLAPDLILQDL